MNIELLKTKMRAYFNMVDPDTIIEDFKKMGYSFVDIDEYAAVKKAVETKLSITAPTAPLPGSVEEAETIVWENVFGWAKVLDCEH